MRLARSILTFALFFGSFASWADDSESLERRGSIGIALQPSASGIVVAAPPTHPIYQEAGIKAGSVLRAISGQPVTNWIDLQALTHQLPAGLPVELTFDLEGVTRSVTMLPKPAGPSEVSGAEVYYDEVRSADGLRIRTITLIPDSSTLANENGVPGVFYIQGITCQSIDQIAGRSHNRSRIFLDLLDAGFAVSFADKPGVGDSDGIACREGGFNPEVKAYQAAAQAFASHEAIDATRLYAIGISMGGYQFPLVADAVDFAGAVSWGAGVSPWADYLISNFRTRAMLHPVTAPAAQDDALRAQREVVSALLIQGLEPDEVRQLMPESASMAEQQLGPLESFAGRALVFHREADTAALWPAWERYQGRLLVLHGEYDWIATESDHALAAQIVNRNHPGSARVEILKGLDHGFTHHDDLESSFTSLFSGEPSILFHQRAVAWLTELATQQVAE
jgi:pimeloyl-ACP methyl ester carboxylesterase